MSRRRRGVAVAIRAAVSFFQALVPSARSKRSFQVLVPKCSFPSARIECRFTDPSFFLPRNGVDHPSQGSRLTAELVPQVEGVFHGCALCGVVEDAPCVTRCQHRDQPLT